MPREEDPESLLLRRKPGLTTTGLAVVSQGLVLFGSDFLQKLFTGDELLVKVRKVRDGQVSDIAG